MFTGDSSPSTVSTARRINLIEEHHHQQQHEQHQQQPSDDSRESDDHSNKDHHQPGRPDSDPVTSSSASGKRPRGRPPGSKNKAKPPIIVTRDSPNALRSHVLEEETAPFLTSLRQPATPGNGGGVGAGAGGVVTLHGRFEILSLTGTVLPPPAPPGAGGGGGPPQMQQAPSASPPSGVSGQRKLGGNVSGYGFSGDPHLHGWGVGTTSRPPFS
ncbi:hypothetical protein Bca52824_014292 [Brassica carinata]|uniref:AT-hook motif nuclear-localized protein n=1 Tax=Brassica carinata TaxID=52824 RepID=A0A8X7W0S5_BRACI|nr:hypothetical protein Bca52824_014292 [Brassica carinata]